MGFFDGFWNCISKSEYIIQSSSHPDNQLQLKLAQSAFPRGAGPWVASDEPVESYRRAAPRDLLFDQIHMPFNFFILLCLQDLEIKNPSVGARLAIGMGWTKIATPSGVWISGFKY